ncbi:MAG: hypothetical protein ABWX57_05860 [Aeromicrobium sp.]
MTSKWITVLAGAIAAVVTFSVVVGLASPDGSVGDDTPTSATVAPSSSAPSSVTPPPSPAADRPTAARAPAAVEPRWAGRPAATTVKGSRVDWCPAVRMTGAAEAERVFGRPATRAAACVAVRFVLDRHYSRISLPRRSYATGDLDFVLPALSDPAAATYRSRIARFVAAPGDTAARAGLGLVLLRGVRTAGHADAGRGRVFYGPAFTTTGYRGRSVWINPTWSRVSIRVDWAKATPRIVATLTASAAVPVFNTVRVTDDMMTVPTHATLILRHQGGRSWRIGGWDTLTTGPSTYARLDVR